MTHGHSCGGKLSPTYRSWRSMWARVRSKPLDSHYAFYAGKGVTVCERWKSFEDFLSDMGDRPEGKTLDRIDNNGNYEASNCRWSTPIQQARNRRNQATFTLNGETHSVMEWVKKLNLPLARTYWRHHAGWTPEQIVSTQFRPARG